MDSNDTLKLRQAMTMLKRVHARSLKLSDLDHREFHLLKSISAHRDGAEGITIGKLAETYKISKPAISNLIRITEQRGLVERQTDKSDRRVVWVKLTDKGRSELERTASYWEELGKRIAHKFGEKNVELFICLITRLAEVVDEIINEERGKDV